MAMHFFYNAFMISQQPLLSRILNAFNYVSLPNANRHNWNSSHPKSVLEWALDGNLRIEECLKLKSLESLMT